MRHDSFTVYIELNDSGTATPKRVYVQSPFSHPKSRVLDPMDAREFLLTGMLCVEDCGCPSLDL